jgi:chromate transporter
MDSDRRGNVKEVIALFLRLGFTAFGGPAAHIAMMHDEVVKRRKWLDEQEFLDLLGATNLIPGPNSTEMTIHIGYVRAGWVGLILGGASFILPAMLIVMGLAWAYVHYGATPAAEWLLYGVKPVVIAIVVQAIWNLGRKAFKGIMFYLIGLAVFGLYFLGINELALLFAGGVLVLVIEIVRRKREPNLAAAVSFLSQLSDPVLGNRASYLFQNLVAAIQTSAPFSLPLLFLTFLKIGSVLYGSGYVLLAFVRADFVSRLGWLTDQQLIDAIAIGQVTPGPVFTTATFIGYILGGAPGALLGTLGIFLPAFIFVAITNPVIPRIRSSPTAAALLDGVNAASLGLMAAVTVQLSRGALIDPYTIALGLISIVLILRFKVNTTWLVLGGALAGLLISLVQ